MSTLEDRHQKLVRLQRLRKLGVRRGVPALATPPTPGEDVPAPAIEPASAIIPTPYPQPEPSTFNLPPSTPALPGAEVETPFGPAWVRVIRYPLSERPDLVALLGLEPDALVAAGRDATLAGLDTGRSVFIDTETTGLTADTSTYTFLVGIGRFELPATADPIAAGAFVVRQIFMRHPGEERAQMYLVAEALDGAAGIVSFNGRGFDLPLVQNRFVLSRLPFPWIGLPHLDLLPASRRVWRTRLESCRLTSLEQNILGVQRSEDDVPGYQIPDIYREYYRSGVVSNMLVRVFYHNLIDITTMPLLAARLGQLYQVQGLSGRVDALHPAERLCLARAYADLGWDDAAELAYRAALSHASADAERTQAYRELGFLLKRLERRDEAAALWEEWVAGVAGEEIIPYVELAKHHEWRTGDLAAARGWAAWALKIVEGWLPGLTREMTLADLRHRLARIEAKLEGQAPPAAQDEPD